MVHEARAWRQGSLPTSAGACPGSGDLREGPGALRGDAAPGSVRDRVKRSLLRVRALLPQAARPRREIHARRVSRGKRLLRQQLAAMETRQRRADRIDAARRLADPARARARVWVSD